MLDIKSKSKFKIRSIMAVLVLALFSVGTIAAFPWFNRMAQEYLTEYDTTEYTENALRNWVSEIYQGCYVLYYEKEKESTGKSAGQIFLDCRFPENEEEITSDISVLLQYELDNMDGNFESIRDVYDYCILENGKLFRKNTSQPLEEALSDLSSRILQEYYTDYFLIDFGESGGVTIQPLYADRLNTDFLIKLFDNVSRKNILRERLSDQYIVKEDYVWKQPTDFQVIIGIPDTEEARFGLEWEVGYHGSRYTYWQLYNAYMSAGVAFFYWVMLFAVVVLVFLMTSKKIWKAEISMNRPRGCYLFEASVIGGLVCIGCTLETFPEIMWNVEAFQTYSRMYQALFGKGMMDLVMTAVGFFLLYGSWYLCIRFLRPVFTLGPREYIRQYSLIYQLFPWIGGHWRRFRKEISHIDFSRNAVWTILKVVILNFVITLLFLCMWFFGIVPLFLYTVALFFILMHHYDKIRNDYGKLLEGMHRLAEGDLEVEIQEDLGHFEPLKKELSTIRYGLKKAVEKEVKSERMKTELITNVSHDLKTPLTAITTYIELLKKEDLTSEERDSYIEILENKAFRLKVLIEDLFEVSKASSRNIVLNLVEVDVVNLLKQVSVEHTSQFENSNLKLRWELPEEKLLLQLDSTKTYRIFENLFVNICKYAMEGSRVYIQAAREAAGVVITMKNVSAEEINVNPEELTERFVRGDASRNTEGSGLGLAIAKSFTEAQNGIFTVEVDGDLFKVVIRFPDIS